VREAVTYVAGMTDRYAFTMAMDHLGWDPANLPQGVDWKR
jgi:dGTPase